MLRSQLVFCASVADLYELCSSYSSLSTPTDSLLCRRPFTCNPAFGEQSKVHSLHGARAVLDPNEIIEPPLIVKMLQRGWVSHPPLHLLTTARCLASQFITSTSTNVLTLEDGKMHLSDASIDSTGEAQMSLSDFIEAWPRFCSLIERYLPGPNSKGIADRFRTHFSFIVSRTDFTANFPLYLAYDIHIRQHFILHHEEFSPADWHQPIWNDIVRRADAKQLADFSAKLAQMAASSAIASSPNSKIGSRGSFRQNTPAKTPKGNTGGQTPSKTETRASKGVCIVCGLPSHTGADCPSDGNGYLSKVDGKWVGPNGSSVCYRDNTTQSCTRTGCPFEHVCSRCGSRDHNAQSHT